MAKMSFEASMADLERMQGPPEVVLEEAAKILGIDLEKSIQRSSVEPLYKTTLTSQGFKEQWVLRWLLKKLKLGVPDAKSKSIAGESQTSFTSNAKFWSILLNVTCSIPNDVCSEILLERHFYEALTELIQGVLRQEEGESATFDASATDAEHEGPPTKKRRLSRSSSLPQNGQVELDTPIWIASQAACRCVDLFDSSSSEMTTPHRNVSMWTGSLQTQAALLGMLLESVHYLLRHNSRVESCDLAVGMLNTLLAFWDNSVSASSLRDDERQQAFASHCLTPCLSLLDHLIGARSDQASFTPSRNNLERLIAVNVVFPLRTTFNEQFTKKWRATADILLYEQMDTLLQAYDRQTLPSEGGSDVSRAVAGSSMQQFSWIVLDVAARSVPFTDLRRLQQEQPYLDSLLIWLVHATWPHVPRVTSTGVLRQQFAEDQGAWVSPLELLLDVARSRKLHISLPIISYILQAVLATEPQSAPWSLLIKVIQLGSDILVPDSTSSASKSFLSQVVSRIESSTVTTGEYNLVRDWLVLPLMRDCARSRAFGVFVEVWQQCLAESMRVRYTSKHSHDIPTVLVWEDDDVFDEFKTLSVLHAPPGMAGRMLKDLVESVKGLGEKIGSTTGEFAKLAIFSVLLESMHSSGEQLGLAMDQLASLLRGAVEVLRRKSDFQGQRWRLRKLVRLLVDSTESKALPQEVDSLLEPSCNFLSLSNVCNFDPDHSGTQEGKFLECLECFSLAIELAGKLPRFKSKLEAEMHHLQEAAAAHMSSQGRLWNGRSGECCDVEALVMACIGRLLQRAVVFSMYPDIFGKFIGHCVKEVTTPPSSTLAETTSPNLLDLSMAALQDGQVSCAPLLRKALFESITAALWADETDMKACRSVLESVGIETMTRAAVEKLADGLRDRLFRRAGRRSMDSIAKDMSYLIYLDTLFPGIFISIEHLDEWCALSEREFEFKDGIQSPLSAMKKADLSTSYLLAVDMLRQVLQAMWARAVAARNTPSLVSLVSWMVKKFEESEKQLSPKKTLPFSCVQILLLCACRSTGSDPTMVQEQQLHEMEEFYLKRTIHHLDLMSQEEFDQDTVFLLKLALDGIGSGPAIETKETLQQATAVLLDKLRGYNQSHAKCPDAKFNGRVALSIRRKCVSSGVQSAAGPLQEEVSEWIQKLPSCDNDSQVWTYATITSLAASADLFTRQRGAGEWSNLLQVLRRKAQDASYQPACAVVVASVITHVKQQHIAQYPELAQELAEVASLASNAEKLHGHGLALALENCRRVLELHPVVVNQSTLDRLLSSLRILASSTTENTTQLNSIPSSARIYEQLCAVVGAILGRHRRRVSDRYHLLLPVLQTLLRCLFWPGKTATERRQGTAVEHLLTFAKTLPSWMRDSSEPLPLSSADQISRLFSSVCNPTVSAARSSHKRRNELNDEVKQARKLAGQHMQYLVTEYCRCFLDGQIAPSMKDQLMAGMYRVLDAIDKDVMRAMNAGMDPSTRAVFKNLYDAYQRYGRWDKS